MTTETLVQAKDTVPSRRDFLKAGLGAGGALFFVFGIPSIAKHIQATASAADEAASLPSFKPNAFIKIDPDGEITLTIPQVEMGQGIYTSMSMLIAEELEIDLQKVKIAPAPADDKLYGNPLIGFQNTGGSTSVRAFYRPLRLAGATAREMLIAAAAKTWSVDAVSCRARNGSVFHEPTGRSLNYGQLVETAAAIPVPPDVKIKSPRDFKLIGTAAKRLDIAEKVNGRALFGIDVRVPGMKIATVASCPVFGGRLKSVDDAQAKAVKSVRQVVLLDNAVAVIADHMGAARKGLAALKIEWDDGENANFSSAKIVQDMAAAAQNSGVVARSDGNVQGALAQSSKTLEAAYELPFLAHAAMEPINCTLHVRPDGCEVWVGTQVMTRAQAAVAQVTGLPLDKVVVHNHYLGGGFGRRLEVDSIIQAALIAKQVEGPVKVVWTREEDIQHDNYRPYYYDRLRAGLDAAGKPIAFEHRVTGSSIVARWLPAMYKQGLDPDAVGGAAGAYDFTNVLVDYVRHEPPRGLTTTWWRGVGVTHNAFVVECFLDELATAAGKDPLEYRRSLLGHAPRARVVLDLAAEKAGWGSSLPAGSGRGIALINGFGTYLAQVAEVTATPDGKVRVNRVVCAVDAGIVVNPDTVKAQIEGGIMFGLTAALYGEITFKGGRVEQGNFDTYQMLRIDEAPRVEVHIVRNGEEPGGIGEPGTSAIAPAVANAVFAATGTRLRRLPINLKPPRGA